MASQGDKRVSQLLQLARGAPIKTNEPTLITLIMTNEQRHLALALIAACEKDEVTQANAKVYGDWLSHLMDELADETADAMA